MTYLKFILVILLNFFNFNLSYKYDIKNILNNVINETNITNKMNTTNKMNITNKTNITNTLKLKNNTEIIPPYLRRKSKFCHIKCDCFFSHTVNNDNICVNNWIRTPGLGCNTMNDNICVTNWIKYT